MKLFNKFFVWLLSIVALLFGIFVFLKQKKSGNDNGKNNPMFIEYSLKNDWKGAIRPHNGSRFDNFSNVKYGLRAGRIIIQNYSKRGLNTIKKIISTWAPPVENNTDKYVKFVSSSMGIGEDVDIDVFNDDVMFLLMRAMCKMESNYNLTKSKYYEIV